METQTNSKSRFNVGYFFLCVGVLVTLITSVVSFLNLIFETLNKRFPDALNASYQYGYNTYDYESIRASLATLIIVFPIFLAITYYWRKFSSEGMTSLDEMFKKWVMYIILFLSAVISAVDLIVLVRYFISGEITSRFILKVLAVLIVAGLIGLYYLHILRREGSQTSGRDRIFGGVAALLVVLAISYSFMIIGSPMEQRSLRLDMRRVNDLQTIQYQIINFWQQKEKLPANLSELTDPLSGFSLPVDPEFEKGRTYEYALKGPLTFELCATFARPMPQGWQEYGGYYGGGGIMPMFAERDKAVSYPYPYPGGGMNESWDHEEGRTCFERTIDKELYPPYPKPTSINLPR
ncbi:MAG: DUF5671 domain-containing protein [Candidatus Paceibacterota bacterium]